MRLSRDPAERIRWYLRPLFWLQRRRWGQVLLPAATWARVPAYYAALTAFYAAIERRGSPLEPALRSVLQVRVSQLVHCAFCVDLNASIAERRAVTPEKALAIETWRASALFTQRERLALEYAEAVTAAGVTDELATRVRAEFGEEAFIELTGLVAFQNLSARFNAALDLPAQGFCRSPGPHP